MAKKLKPRICVDRVIPFQYKIQAAEVARAVNPRNRPDHPFLLGVSRHPLKMALETGKKWPDGKKLGVRFLDGSSVQRERLEEHADAWSNHADITFNFSAGSKAEIRISFEFDPDSSWSAVGTDCLVSEWFPKNEPTMNYGWLLDDTEDAEYRRVVLHEFGHALGAIHEHQNPKGGIKWNLPAVYAYFSGPPNNWTKEEIDHNVVQKYSIDQLNASKYDRKSIMLYSFPAAFIKGGKATPNNTRLSAGDKKFIGKMYPK